MVRPNVTASVLGLLAARCPSDTDHGTATIDAFYLSACADIGVIDASIEIGNVFGNCDVVVLFQHVNLHFDSRLLHSLYEV